jgi:hypothetical protein
MTENEKCVMQQRTKERDEAIKKLNDSLPTMKKMNAHIDFVFDALDIMGKRILAYNTWCFINNKKPEIHYSKMRTIKTLLDEEDNWDYNSFLPKSMLAILEDAENKMKD